MNEIICPVIGTIRTPYKTSLGVPIRSGATRRVGATVELKPEFEDGLKDLEGFSHIYLIFNLHLSTGYDLHVKPFLDDSPRGLFSTRAPRRPAQIGLSVVRLRGVEGNILHIEDPDMVDGTPLLDIKPFIPDAVPRGRVRIGWLKGRTGRMKRFRSDHRFDKEAGSTVLPGNRETGPSEGAEKREADTAPGQSSHAE